MEKEINLKNVYTNENETLLRALEQLDEVGTQILFIVRESKLVACLSDGDIRKAILAGKALTTKVSEVCNYHPIFLLENEASKAKKIIEEKSLQAIPILNEEREIIKIVFRAGNYRLYLHQKFDIPVVMMAGGLGTRLFPYTKILPKPLLPIADIPISERIILNFKEYGCGNFFMIVNYKKEMIKAYYHDVVKDYKLTFVEETEPLGTGGGLQLLKGQIQEPFILTNCDILIKEDLSRAYEYHHKEKNIATMICSLKNYKIPYGIVKFGEKGQIEEMQEKPNMSFFTNTGCYILEPGIMNYIPKGKQIGMPEILELAQKSGERIGAYPISENSWMDMGQLDTFEVMSNKIESEL